METIAGILLGILLIGVALVLAVSGLNSSMAKVASELERIADLLRKIKDNTIRGR